MGARYPPWPAAHAPALERQRGGDPGASARGAHDSQPASERGDTVVESEQAGSVGAGAADSVVPYVDVQHAVFDARLDFRAPGAGVLDDVRERFGDRPPA
jgi:hypothetical protein